MEQLSKAAQIRAYAKNNPTATIAQIGHALDFKYQTVSGALKTKEGKALRVEAQRQAMGIAPVKPKPKRSYGRNGIRNGLRIAIYMAKYPKATAGDISKALDINYSTVWNQIVAIKKRAAADRTAAQEAHVEPLLPLTLTLREAQPSTKNFKLPTSTADFPPPTQEPVQKFAGQPAPFQFNWLNASLYLTRGEYKGYLRGVALEYVQQNNTYAAVEVLTKLNDMLTEDANGSY